jgi:hypothetical protein
MLCLRAVVQVSVFLTMTGVRMPMASKKQTLYQETPELLESYLSSRKHHRLPGSSER